MKMRMNKKNIIILLTFITLTTQIAYATDELPPLPLLEEKVITKAPLELNESFFQRIKNFFVGKKTKNNTQVASEVSQVNRQDNNTPQNQANSQENKPLVDLNNIKLSPKLVEKADKLEIPIIKDNENKQPVQSTAQTKQNEVKKVAVAAPAKPIISTTPPEVISNKPPTESYALNPPEFIVKKQTQQVAVKPNEHKVVSTSTRLSDNALKFVDDEAKVLLLQNDDVVLGEVTEKAKTDLMDSNSYIALFVKFKQMEVESQMHDKILGFIRKHNVTKKHIYNQELLKQIYQDAFNSVNKDNLFDLKTLIDNYSVLQTTDSNGYTLLHEAAKTDHYTMAKYLIMRGININAADINKNTALEIANRFNNTSIYNLLKRSGAM